MRRERTGREKRKEEEGIRTERKGRKIRKKEGRKIEEKRREGS